MLLIIALACAAATALYTFSYFRGLRRNVAIAKKSGIPYVILPIHNHHIAWIIGSNFVLPLVYRLVPEHRRPLWLKCLDIEWPYTLGYAPFKEIGSDVFLLVAHSKIRVCVADAEAASDIVTRRFDFPKPIRVYKSIDLYGKNVVTTEGMAWRHHRKITAPSFSERNNWLVWTESLHQAQAMITSWAGSNGSTEKMAVPDLGADTMRLALHVISRAGFGARVLWPHEEVEGNIKSPEAAIASSPGHTMKYREALGVVLERLLTLALFPKWFLDKSPLQYQRNTAIAYAEWGKYMSELFNAKQAEVRAGKSTQGLDLLGTLVRGAGIAEQDINTDPEKTGGRDQLLSYDEIIGNAFIFILAGHETTANVLNFSMLFLAINPKQQKHLQHDIDQVMGSRPVEEWDYEEDFPKLFGSMPAAVMNETLRLIPPIIGIPKCTDAGSPQPLTVNGQRVVVPENSAVDLMTCGLHKNPKYWQSVPDARGIVPEDDLDLFRPERWLLDPNKAQAPPDTSSTYPEAGEAGEAGDLQGPEGADTSTSLWKPAKCAWLPFSEGYRSCLGRRFAQVEAIAVLAYIFREYSVELAVDDFATPEEVDRMPAGGEERRAVWDQASDRAKHFLKTKMKAVITLQMRGAKVPLRLVKRGSEQFLWD